MKVQPASVMSDDLYCELTTLDLMIQMIKEGIEHPRPRFSKEDYESQFTPEQLVELEQRIL